jgi:acetoacetyl-CoA reductase/3-oxoacyl-[acyl-carrier protein] reductase
MRAAGYGRIINFSSVVAQTPVPGTSAYAASKAALWGLSRALAVENASKGITINSLNLGYFDLGIIREVPADLQQSVKARIPSGSFGRPDQIYQAIKFVIATEYMNGASLDLNGGMV